MNVAAAGESEGEPTEQLANRGDAGSCMMPTICRVGGLCGGGDRGSEQWARITNAGKTSGRSFIGDYQKMGFKRDGFGEAHYYDLDPPLENDQSTATHFADMSLDEPLPLK